MDSIWINAPAKINIGLDVIRRREDGYHEVKIDNKPFLSSGK